VTLKPTKDYQFSTFKGSFLIKKVTSQTDLSESPSFRIKQFTLTLVSPNSVTKDEKDREYTDTQQVTLKVYPEDNLCIEIYDSV
jgi:hypothetical protein